MTKKKKILRRVLITLGALILLLVLDILFWLGPTVEFLVETVGPKALGTPVHIESLSINPRKGTVLLTGFSIENPASFGNSNAVAVTELDLAVSMGSLFSDTVTVHRIRLESPHLVFEQNRASDNIAEFIQSLLDFAGYDPEEPPKEKKPKQQKDPEQKSRITLVEAVEINDAQFHLAHTDDSMLDVGIHIEQLSASMTNGAVQLKGLRVTNPNSLSTVTLFTLDAIDLLIDPATFYQAPLTILDLRINKPHAFVEWAADVSTISEFLNITEATLQHVAAWPIPESRADAAPAAPKPEPPPPPELRKAVISDIRFHIVNSVDPLLSMHVGVEKVEADLSEGAVQLGRIYITNPGRLTTPDLFSLAGIEARFDAATLYAPPLSIRDVQAHQPHIFLENNAETDTVAELIKIADTITGSLPTNGAPSAASAKAAEPAAPTETQETAPSSPAVELHRLAIDDIQLKLLDTTVTNAPAEPVMVLGIREVLTELVDGRLRITDMTIPNPPGFHATNLYHLAEIRVAIDPQSIHSEQTVIHEIFIDSPQINLEQTEEAGNLTELQKSLMAFMPPAAETTDSEPAPSAAPATNTPPVALAEQPVVLETLLVTNLQISAILLPPLPDTNNVTPEAEGKVRTSLNPMHYMGRGNTNETQAPVPQPMRLIAYDLLTIKPLAGTVRVDNLKIGNPHGFANEHLAKLDQFELGLDPDSLITDTLVITNIHIHNPRVTYERQIMTDNIKTFQKTVEGAVARREVVIEKTKDEYNVEDKEQKVIIEHLIIEGGIVRAKISALPTTPIPLPTIEMKDIGKEEGGASVSEATSKVFGTFYDSIIGVVANTTGIAGDALKGAGALTFDALGNLTNGIGGLFGAGGEQQVDVQKKEAKPKKKRRHLFRSRKHK